MSNSPDLARAFPASISGTAAGLRGEAANRVALVVVVLLLEEEEEEERCVMLSLATAAAHLLLTGCICTVTTVKEHVKFTRNRNWTRYRRELFLLDDDMSYL
jgi:hypothetical protein